MVLFRLYDEAKKLDRIWYKSSNIVYSECDDNENDYKTLRVTFKNGSTYQYNEIDVNDYVLFVHGGLYGSNGKALNQFIKQKYKFEKLDDKNVSSLLKECENLLENTKNNKKNE